MKLADGLIYGYEVSLWDGEHWRDLYGMLGRYHKTFRAADAEVRYAFHGSVDPTQWRGFKIERVVVDEDGFLDHDHPMNVTLAQSKNV